MTQLVPYAARLAAASLLAALASTGCTVEPGDHEIAERAGPTAATSEAWTSGAFRSLCAARRLACEANCSALAETKEQNCLLASKARIRCLQSRVDCMKGLACDTQSCAEADTLEQACNAATACTCGPCGN